MQAYSDPSREADPHALPDIEIFEEMYGDTPSYFEDGTLMTPGFYWWSCFPGCLPDGDPVGPFETEAEALEDAQNV